MNDKRWTYISMPVLFTLILVGSATLMTIIILNNKDSYIREEEYLPVVKAFSLICTSGFFMFRKILFERTENSIVPINKKASFKLTAIAITSYILITVPIISMGYAGMEDVHVDNWLYDVFVIPITYSFGAIHCFYKPINEKFGFLFSIVCVPILFSFLTSDREFLVVFTGVVISICCFKLIMNWTQLFILNIIMSIISCFDIPIFLTNIFRNNNVFGFVSIAAGVVTLVVTHKIFSRKKEAINSVKQLRCDSKHSISYIKLGILCLAVQQLLKLIPLFGLLMKNELENISLFFQLLCMVCILYSYRCSDDGTTKRYLVITFMISIGCNLLYNLESDILFILALGKIFATLWFMNTILIFVKERKIEKGYALAKYIYYGCIVVIAFLFVLNTVGIIKGWGILFGICVLLYYLAVYACLCNDSVYKESYKYEQNGADL